MAGMQKVLQNALQSYLNAKNGSSGLQGPCVGNLTATMKEFCEIGQIPDFIKYSECGNAMQNAESKSKANYSLPMPNFTTGPFFSSYWPLRHLLPGAPFSASDIGSIQTNISAISPAEIQTAKMSRAIAIQQMYKDLSTVAQLMVANSPALNPAAN